MDKKGIYAHLMKIKRKLGQGTPGHHMWTGPGGQHTVNGLAWRGTVQPLRGVPVSPEALSQGQAVEGSPALWWAWRGKGDPPSAWTVQ